MTAKPFVIASYIIWGVALVIGASSWIHVMHTLSSSTLIIDDMSQTIDTQRNTIKELNRQIELYTAFRQFTGTEVRVCRHGKCKDYTYQQYIDESEALRVAHDRFWKTYGNRTIVIEAVPGINFEGPATETITLPRTEPVDAFLRGTAKRR